MLLAQLDVSKLFTDSPYYGLLILFAIIIGILLLGELMGLRYIPNNKVGVVEKLWSRTGSVEQGRLLALGSEAGFKADVLRGGFHIGLWRWQFRLHKVPLVTVPQGKIGYVYARDGETLSPGQTLGRVVACNNFQDARTFLYPGEQASLRGQRGRQRTILREGMYAINLALFVVITEDAVFHLNFQGNAEFSTLVDWQRELGADRRLQAPSSSAPLSGRDERRSSPFPLQMRRRCTDGRASPKQGDARSGKPMPEREMPAPTCRSAVRSR